MATRQILTDDIDGSTDDVQPVSFSVNGTTYSLDLGADNRAAMVEALQPFIMNATPSRRSRTKGKPRAEGTSDVRRWARDNGFAVRDRGRIPQHVQDAYAAHH